MRQKLQFFFLRILKMFTKFLFGEILYRVITANSNNVLVQSLGHQIAPTYPDLTSFVGVQSKTMFTQSFTVKRIIAAVLTVTPGIMANTWRVVEYRLDA